VIAALKWIADWLSGFWQNFKEMFIGTIKSILESAINLAKDATVAMGLHEHLDESLMFTWVFDAFTWPYYVLPVDDMVVTFATTWGAIFVIRLLRWAAGLIPLVNLG